MIDEPDDVDVGVPGLQSDVRASHNPRTAVELSSLTFFLFVLAPEREEPATRACKQAGLLAAACGCVLLLRPQKGKATPSMLTFSPA